MTEDPKILEARSPGPQPIRRSPMMGELGHGRPSLLRWMRKRKEPTVEDSWRDYDHGFRDGYQSARLEGPDALLEAARWVVDNWDREATQHASMAALRKAVQRYSDD